MSLEIKNDRRKHFRMQFKNRKGGRAEFILPNGSRIKARLLDVGGGGLRCAISRETTEIPAINTYFDRIYVFSTTFGNPLIFSGIVRRKKALSGRQGIELGVEFSAVLSNLHEINENEEIVRKRAQRLEVNKNFFLARLQQTQAYGKVRDIHRRGERRTDLHYNFHDIAFGLPPEERWWFYCVIDSLKNTGQRYQKGLLVEYLDLCRKGTGGYQRQ
ncbi:MAG: hypothetical protein DWQ05_02570 [Calditrichaeota bacterium]|nr:MAG: hypothetical protein DWQ05_02570 [Calditrichota bacterium]